VNFPRVVQQGAQAVEVVDGVAQGVPCREANLIQIQALIVSLHRAAGLGSALSLPTIQAGGPAGHGCQDAQESGEVLCVVALHAGHGIDARTDCATGIPVPEPYAGSRPPGHAQKESPITAFRPLAPPLPARQIRTWDNWSCWVVPCPLRRQEVAWAL
jgi:hypothetical protein